MFRGHDCARRLRGRALHPNILLVLWALLVGCWADTSEAFLKAGEEARPVTLVMEDGGALELDHLFGDRPVLLAFMGSRCLPCEESLPALTEIAATYGPSHGLEVLCVYLATGSAMNRMRALGDEHPGLRFLRDRIVGDRWAAAEAYGVMGTPTFFLIGRDRRVQWSGVGRLRPSVHGVAIAQNLSIALPDRDGRDQ